MTLQLPNSFKKAWPRTNTCSDGFCMRGFPFVDHFGIVSTRSPNKLVPQIAATCQIGSPGRFLKLQEALSTAAGVLKTKVITAPVSCLKVQWFFPREHHAECTETKTQLLTESTVAIKLYTSLYVMVPSNNFGSSVGELYTSDGAALVSPKSN